MGNDLFTYRKFGQFQLELIEILKKQDFLHIIKFCNGVIDEYLEDKTLVNDDKYEFLYFFQTFLGIGYAGIGDNINSVATFKFILSLPKYNDEAGWIKYSRKISINMLERDMSLIGFYVDKIIETYNL